MSRQGILREISKWAPFPFSVVALLVLSLKSTETYDREESVLRWGWPRDSPASVAGAPPMAAVTS